MARDIDYEAVVIPDDVPPTEYEYPERRADILRIVKDVGNPYRVKRVDLAEHYGVSPPTITRDFERLGSFVATEIGRDAKLTARYAMEKAVKELQEEGEYVAAFQVAMDWNRWLQSIGEQERVAIEADITHREAATESDDYVLLEDAEADAVSADADSMQPPMPVSGSGSSSGSDGDGDGDGEEDATDE